MIDYWIVVRADIASRSRRGGAPVPGPLPAGTYIRDGAEFNWLDAEVRRADAEGLSGVDWSRVSALSLDILSSQSKDILVACWATYSLFKIEGYEGLAVGLGLLCRLVEAHWEQLFPSIEQEHARLGAVNWLVARLGPELSGNEPIEADSSAVIAAYDSLGDLARQLRGKLADEQVALNALLRTLRSHYERAIVAITTVTEHAVEAVEAAEQAAAALHEAASPRPLNQERRM
ncbi:type VI secretion system ImpA/VasJ family protein [Bradyrhizobium elkanii]|nr:type VI secretion system ImpA/VasJ family protein [Bradyrhizobium elkanii]